jgi:oligopeptidase A
MANNTLPDFAAFDPAKVGAQIDQLITQLQASVKAAEQASPTWQDFYLPLEQSSEQLQRAWGIVSHLNGVADSPALRAAYEEKLQDITQAWTEIGQNKILFEQYKKLKNSDQYQAASATRKRIIDKALQGFELSGAALVSPARERYATIQDESAQLAQDFSKRALDATNAYTLHLESNEQVAGLPADVVAAAKAEAQNKGKHGWYFSLRMPSYLPIMQYADDRLVRETIYRAYCTRASESGPADLDNSKIIEQTLALRAEESALLGFGNFAELSLATKMADTPTQVERFLRDLGKKAKPFAMKELEELRKFAGEKLGIQNLQAWDVAYVSEKLKEERYSFSEQEVRQYFQSPKVLKGLFAKIEELFSVSVVKDQTSVWDDSVEFYRIERTVASGKKELVGQFYIDLYARESKRSGAWMDDARGRNHTSAQVQTPVAYLVCNFTPPVDGKPSLLTHDEVTTLFHEMGHGLHHLLTRIDDLAVSGINGVEWDAVELPSQFMENFCWEWPCVQAMSSHIDTSAPLPRALFEKMTAAKNFQAAMQTMRQLEFALFDMQLHSSAKVPNVQATLDAVRQEVAVVMPPAYNRFQNSFSHIFAGGYAAGYYSYKWAEVLSADCYAAFEEKPSESVAIGKKFLQEILSAGGSRPAIDSFRAFRGRDPQIDALLRHNGLQENLLTNVSHA